MILTQTMYRMGCDTCGEQADDGAEVCWWSDIGYASDQAIECDWVLDQTPDGESVAACSSCATTDRICMTPEDAEVFGQACGECWNCEATP